MLAVWLCDRRHSGSAAFGFSTLEGPPPDVGPLRGGRMTSGKAHAWHKPDGCRVGPYNFGQRGDWPLIR